MALKTLLLAFALFLSACAPMPYLDDKNTTDRDSQFIRETWKAGCDVKMITRGARGELGVVCK